MLYSRTPLVCILGACALAAGVGVACGEPRDAAAVVASVAPDSSAALSPDLPYRLSLAQWSLNRRYRQRGGDPYAFPAHARALGFEGVEYVSQLYAADLEPPDGDPARYRTRALAVVGRLDSAARAAGVTQALIMIDNEGDVSSANAEARARAIQNHQHWIEAAASVGIPTVRINAGGDGPRRRMHEYSVASLREFGAFAKTRGVNVVVENHGGNSSDPRFLAGVMAAVAMDNVGILPDFGNWCRRRADADGGGATCVDRVPPDSIYAAVGAWMPYAHAVSAKSYAFDADGGETTVDFARMLDTVLAHGYTGFVGVEYEGETDEVEGIALTKALLERVGRSR